MAEARPYFPFYAKDWLGSASVSSMPLAAQGLYARLLAFAWLSDGLPADEDALRRLASVERSEWKRIWPAVAPLWEARDGRLYQAKQERVRQEQTAYSETKRIAGSKGGRRSVERRAEVFGSTDPRSNAEAKREAEGEAQAEAGGEAAVKPSSASSSTKKRSPLTPKGDAVPFDRFWSAYPIKASKAASLKAWAKLQPDEALFEAMLAALSWQSKADQWQRGIIPHASTWLNNRRWEDDKPAAISSEDAPRIIDWANV